MTAGEISASRLAGKASDAARVEPYGPKPQHRISAGRIGLYAFLSGLGALLSAAALHDDRHVAEGNARDQAGATSSTLPREITFQPWVEGLG